MNAPGQTTGSQGDGRQPTSGRARLERAVHMLGLSNLALAHIADEASLLREVCRVAVEEGGYVLAVVALAEQDAERTLRPVAHAGPGEGFLERVCVSWSAGRPEGRGPGGTAVRTGRPSIARDILTEPGFAAWREAAVERGFRSVAALPLSGEGRVLGVLAVFSPHPDAFDDEEMVLLTQVAANLAVGIAAQRVLAHDRMTLRTLARRERYLRSVYENSPLAYHSLDEEGRIAEVNPAWCALTGYTREEALGRSFVTLLPPEDHAAFAGHFTDFLERREVRAAPLSLVRRDGVRLEVEIDGRIVGESGDARWSYCLLHDVTARRRAEEDQARHRHFLESMDRINRSMRGAEDLDEMLRAVLDETLALFGCDRAFLLYPCDPDAPSWHVPMECTRPGFPGALALGVEIPMLDEVAQVFRSSLEAGAPLGFGPGNPHPLPEETARVFTIRSQLLMAVHPKPGRPWQFGIHQCSRERVWTPAESDLFQEIGRRLADGLTSVLAHRDLRESEARLRTLVQTIPDLVWLKDPEGVYLSCNPRFGLLYGTPESGIIGRTDFDFVDADQAEFFRANDRRAIEAGRPVVNEEWLTFAADGHRGLFETIKTPMRDASGRLVGVLGIARDVTERKRAEEQQQIAATAFEAQEGIVITDADEVILRVNRAFTEMTGYAPEDAVGQTPRLLKSGRQDAAFYAAMWDELGREGSWQGEVWNRRKNGEVYPEWLSITAVTDGRGEVTHYVATHVDMTARKEAERQIEYLAFYDSLTGLPNRRLLIDRLRQALAGSARSGAHVALLLIDLDNFKIVNETRGHEVGDRLLVEVARRLTSRVREGDTVARLGGDEFVVMLEDLDTGVQEAAARAKAAAEKVLSALNTPFEAAGRVHHMTPSIGLTLFSGTGQSAEELVTQADIAMYQAKSAGRNTLRFFDPDMQSALAARAGMEAALRLAIRDRQFVLHYQPQVDAAGRVAGAEALVRWEHPERGLVPPAEFIPLAEDTGLILDIGRWVLETACAQLAAWSTDPGTAHLHVAVNVSAHQFRQDDFVQQVGEALGNAGAPAGRLMLELTESLVLEDVEDTIVKMAALKGLGVGFSMDDFGTGNSSLSNLTRLPLDQVKIDRAFVRNLPDSADDAVVAQTIVTMARSLGLAVVAEGVETEAQRAFLEAQGCPMWQGFLFSRPVPLGSFERLLSEEGAGRRR